MQKLDKPIELEGRIIQNKPIKMKGGVIIGIGTSGIVLRPNSNTKK